MASAWSAASNRSRAAATTASAPVHVGLRLRHRASQPDERVVGQQVRQVVETPTGGGQVSGEPVDRRAIDLQAGGLDASRHRLEVGSERARLVQGGQVAAECEAGGRGGQQEQRQAAQHEDVANAMGPPPATVSGDRLVGGSVAGRRRRSGGSDGSGEAAESPGGPVMVPDGR